MKSTVVCVFQILSLFAWEGSAIAQTPQLKTDFNLTISSTNDTYAYAPSIIYEGGVYHTFYCSAGESPYWDAIRYRTSSDGVTWSSPTVVLTGSDPVPFLKDHGACDPSVVSFGGFYYLFYGNYDFTLHPTSGLAYGGTIGVARSRNISGPYDKLTTSNTWVHNPTNPKSIVVPKVPYSPGPDGENGYGAGQPTVVNRNGVLYMWYSDWTADRPTPHPNPEVNRQLLTVTRDPTTWPAGVDVLEGTSPTFTKIVTTCWDVKYDIASGKFVEFSPSAANSPDAGVGMRTSSDGIHWSSESYLADLPAGINETAEFGISGSPLGEMTITSQPLFAFKVPAANSGGLPYDLAAGFLEYPGQLQATDPGLSWRIVGAADLNNDGKLDLVWQHTTLGTPAYWLMDGTTKLSDGYFNPANNGVAYSGASDLKLVSVVDITGDGKPDLVWQQISTGAIVSWALNGTLWVQTEAVSHPFGTIGTDWRLAGATDLTGDGKPDLLWYQWSTGAIGCWIMNWLTYVSG
jgi:hypothetical protein